jgi:hypothetical protein
MKYTTGVPHDRRNRSDRIILKNNHLQRHGPTGEVREVREFKQEVRESPASRSQGATARMATGMMVARQPEEHGELQKDLEVPDSPKESLSALFQVEVIPLRKILRFRLQCQAGRVPGLRGIQTIGDI